MTSFAYPTTTPPTVLDTDLVTVTSCRIPKSIPDSTFRLDEEAKQATTIFDLDVMNSLKSPYDAQEAKLRTAPKIYDESADGSRLIAQALAAAKKGHKNVLLQFGANWCLPCHELHGLLKANRSLADELKKDYVVVMIDMNKGHNNDIDEKYGHPTRFGLPGMAVLDSSGRKLTMANVEKWSANGRYSPKKILAFLKEWAPKIGGSKTSR